MLNNKKIDDNQMNQVLKTDLEYVGDADSNITSGRLYFKDAVLSELDKIPSIPKSILTTGGIKIYTTLNSDAQNGLEKAVNERNMGDLQVAAILMNPDNGEILALVGGSDYNKSQFNRAISAKRQVGSTMKPLLYYSALENGFTSASSFISELLFLFLMIRNIHQKTIMIDMRMDLYQWGQLLHTQIIYLLLKHIYF